MTPTTHPHQHNTHPLASAVPMGKWRMLDITRQCDAHLRSLKGLEPWINKLPIVKARVIADEQLFGGEG